MRSLTDAILCESPAVACRLGLPTGAEAVRVWIDPVRQLGGRLADAIAKVRPGNAWTRGMARRNG